MSVGEMAAAGEVHAHQLVAGLQEGEVDRHVGRRAAVRLDVDVLGAEELLGAVDGEALDHVDELAAAVVAAAGVALGVLVRHHAAGGFQHGAADEVLRRDQLEPEVLARALVGDGLVDLRIGGFQRAVIGHSERSGPFALSTAAAVAFGGRLLGGRLLGGRLLGGSLLRGRLLLRLAGVVGGLGRSPGRRSPWPLRAGGFLIEPLGGLLPLRLLLTASCCRFFSRLIRRWRRRFSSRSFSLMSLSWRLARAVFPPWPGRRQFDPCAAPDVKKTGDFSFMGAQRGS